MALVLLIVFLYILSTSCFALALYRTDGGSGDPGPKDPGETPEVSILVPFRNERESLPHLIHDLLGQSYPADRMEILCINDHSEDGSRILFDSLGHAGVRLSCLDLPKGKWGKKEALALGIDHASGPWILQLDADCRIKPGFVASHMAFLEKNPSDLVAGLVTTAEEKGGFLEHFERLDQLSMTGVAAASFHLGRALMCSGANLVYSRELYLKTRVFDPSGQHSSGDDMFLMIGARKLNKVLSFNLDGDSVVQTAPAPSLRSFIDQRIRWGAKSTSYKMPDIQLVALLVAMTNVSVLLFPLWIVLYPALWPYFLGAWIAKTAAEFFFLYRTGAYAGQKKSMKYFLPSTLVYYPVYLLVFVRMIFSQPAWRGKGSVQSSSLN
jgi:cellulose synthase/poly-beta-1,6-N-acetylglucosamine synthase-like glycosyltransferase